MPNVSLPARMWALPNPSKYTGKVTRLAVPVS